MSKYYLGAILLLLTPATAFSQQIEWRPSPEAAFAESQSAGKPVLLHFSADWCRPCSDLKRFVLSDTAVIRIVNQETIPVMIDTDANPDLVTRYSVTNLPTDVLIAEGDRVVLTRTSPQQPQEWIKMLEPGILSAKAVQAGGGARFDSVADLNRQWEENRKASADAPDPFIIDGFHMQKNLKPESAIATQAPAANRFQPSAVVIQNPSAPENSISPANQMANAASTIVIHSDQAAKPNRFQSPAVVIQNPSAQTDSVSSATIVPNSEFYATSGSTGPEPQIQDNVLRSGSSGPGTISFSNPYVKSNSENEPDQSPVKSVAASPPPKPTASCLDGLCPVTVLDEGVWVAGNPAIGCLHRGRTYLFQTVEKRDRFLAAPDRWSPLFAGFDPVAFANEGQLVDGQRGFGIFMKSDGQQQVVLFSSLTNQAEFKASPGKYLEAIQQATRAADERTASLGR